VQKWPETRTSPCVQFFLKWAQPSLSTERSTVDRLFDRIDIMGTHYAASSETKSGVLWFHVRHWACADCLHLVMSSQLMKDFDIDKLVSLYFYFFFVKDRLLCCQYSSCSFFCRLGPFRHGSLRLTSVRGGGVSTTNRAAARTGGAPCL
jgi:hypothetical protein